MKTYFFTVKHEHWRNGTTVAMTAGIVRATNKIEAEDIIFQNVSSTNTFDLTLIKSKKMKTALPIIYRHRFSNKGETVMYLPINFYRFALEELEDYTGELIEAYKIPVNEADEIEERAQARFTFPVNDEDATNKIIYIIFSEYADWICEKYKLNYEHISYYINGMDSSIIYNGINLIEKDEIIESSCKKEQ